MITSKEKAIELIEKFTMDNTRDGERNGIKCALICCNEVLGYMGADRGYEFWTNVKQEIEKL